MQGNILNRVVTAFYLLYLLQNDFMIFKPEAFYFKAAKHISHWKCLDVQGAAVISLLFVLSGFLREDETKCSDR